MDFYKLVFKDPFLHDLQQIVRSVAVHNPSAARQLGESIVRASESLSFFPERHPRLRQRREIRRLIVKKHYKVFYRVQAETRTVEVLRCWDGRRNADPIL